MMRTENTAYWVAWQLARGILNNSFRTTIYGIEHVPREGSFIVASNHASYMDPPAIGGAIPREMAYFARKTLFKPGWSSRLFHQLNSIPVDRDGDSDISAFRKVFQTLNGDRGLLLFPEGTRTPDGKLQNAHKGVGLIACKSAAPVLPVRIHGSYHAYGRNMKIPDFTVSLNIVIGPIIAPAEYDPGKSSPERFQVAAERIMLRLHRLERPKEAGRV